VDFPFPVPNLWLTGDQYVHKLPSMCQPTQSSIPPSSVND